MKLTQIQVIIRYSNILCFIKYASYLTQHNFRDYDECNPKFANKAFVLRNLPDGKLSSTQYCAGSSFDGVTTAPGDSGGPSIIREYNDGVQYTLIGIVSGSFSFSDNIYLLIGHNEVID